MFLNSFNHTSNALKTVASSIYHTSALLPVVLTAQATPGAEGTTATTPA